MQVHVCVCVFVCVCVCVCVRVCDVLKTRRKPSQLVSLSATQHAHRRKQKLGDQKVFQVVRKQVFVDGLLNCVGPHSMCR